jgi:hypothetical protein
MSEHIGRRLADAPAPAMTGGAGSVNKAASGQ